MKLEPKLQGLRVYLKVGEYCISVWTIWAGTDTDVGLQTRTHTHTHKHTVSIHTHTHAHIPLYNKHTHSIAFPHTHAHTDTRFIKHTLSRSITYFVVFAFLPYFCYDGYRCAL